MTNKFISIIDEAVYDYASENSLREDQVLQELREETQKIVGKEMQISPEQGQFMYIFTKLIKARNILEIGTFTGYSTISLARAIPEGGSIITCDKCLKSVNFAEKFWVRAGLKDKIIAKVAPALDTLNDLYQTHRNYFDLIFIDADKKNYDNYFELSLKLLKPNGAILIDNTLWYGKVINYDPSDYTSLAIDQFNRKLKNDSRIDISLLPLFDGLTIVYKK